MSNLLFLGTAEDKSYLPRLKPLFRGRTCFVDCEPISTLAEVELYCRNPKRNITGVISTNTVLLSKLCGKDKPGLDNYAGSYFKRNGIEYVFTNPLEHTVTVPYGGFLLERFTSKLVSPEKWLKSSEFKWRIVNERNSSECFETLRNSKILSCDIETFKENLAIRCIGYTDITFNSDTIDTHSFVVPLDSDFAYSFVERVNNLPQSKIFQNGKYDLSYLSRYGIVPTNYLWDTAALFHTLLI